MSSDLFILGSYHKTGSWLIHYIFKALNQKQAISYKFNNHFNRVSDSDIIKYKCLVIIRNPYEVICSSVRYHQITEESWCNTPRIDLDNNTYREHLSKLQDSEKLLFEMNNSGGDAIRSMYNDMKNRNYNNNIFFLKIEDLYTKEDLPEICELIAGHLDCTNLRYCNLIDSFKEGLGVQHHRTHEKNELTYMNYFKRSDYKEFNKIFPEDTAEILGYDRHD